jgi:serine/threonine protein kinase
MILPLADGDLETLLSVKESVLCIKGDGLWLQVLGITSALDQLHNFENKNHDGLSFSKIGYHHDLKPQNILIRDGVFLLADFGLARLKDTAEDSSTDHKYGALTYGAPESQQQVVNKRSRVSRALDIWSWGCILIEIITFDLLGSEGVIRFRDYRKTETGIRVDHFFHDMKKLKPEVEEWLRYIQGVSSLGNSVSRGNMIVKILAIVERMLSAMPQDRPCSTFIFRGFHRCLREDGISVGELDEELADDEDRLHQETCSNERCVVHAKQSIRVGSDAELPRPELGDSTNTQQIEDMLESLETIFDKDHPVMRALAQSIDERNVS